MNGEEGDGRGRGKWHVVRSMGRKETGEGEASGMSLTCEVTRVNSENAADNLLQQTVTKTLYLVL